MCRWLRNTHSRGSWSVPRTRRRTRAWRRPRAIRFSDVAIALSPGGAGRLARLAADVLVRVLDPFALVRLRRTQRADLRAYLAEQLLVVAFDGHQHLALDLGV